MNDLRLFARSASVFLKIGAAAIGFVAAYFWWKSARSTDAQKSVTWNRWAALTSGASMFLQAISAVIDWWIPGTATFA